MMEPLRRNVYASLISAEKQLLVIVGQAGSQELSIEVLGPFRIADEGSE
jgi:hypothetical protein